MVSTTESFGNVNEVFLLVRLDETGIETEIMGHYTKHQDAVDAAKDLLSEVVWKDDTVKVVNDAPVYKIVRFVRHVKPE